MCKFWASETFLGQGECLNMAQNGARMNQLAL